MVTGTKTVSLVTFKKSVRYAKCTWSRTMRAVTKASKSLYLTAGGRNALEYCSSRLNSFMLEDSPPIDLGRLVPSERVKRSALEALPMDSIKLNPAPGTGNNASFSEGSIVK